MLLPYLRILVVRVLSYFCDHSKSDLWGMLIDGDITQRIGKIVQHCATDTDASILYEHDQRGGLAVGTIPSGAGNFRLND